MPLPAPAHVPPLAVGTLDLTVKNANVTCTLPGDGRGEAHELPWGALEGAAVAPVATPNEFVAAVLDACSAEAPNATIIELEGDIALPPGLAAQHPLPAVLGPGRTLLIRGAEGTTPVLDLGRNTGLLHAGEGSTLVLQRLDVLGARRAAGQGRGGSVCMHVACLPPATQQRLAWCVCSACAHSSGPGCAPAPCRRQEPAAGAVAQGCDGRDRHAAAPPLAQHRGGARRRCACTACAAGRRAWGSALANATDAAWPGRGARPCRGVDHMPSPPDPSLLFTSCPPPAQFEFIDVMQTMPPSPLCQPRIVEAQVTTFRQLGQNGYASVQANGTDVHFADFLAALPVLSGTTKLASECPVWHAVAGGVMGGARPVRRTRGLRVRPPPRLPCSRLQSAQSRCMRTMRHSSAPWTYRAAGQLARACPAAAAAAACRRAPLLALQSPRQLLWPLQRPACCCGGGAARAGGCRSSRRRRMRCRR